MYTDAIEVAHPNGNAIRIIGDVAAPNSCELQFQNASGFVAQNGHRIGLIDGFHIRGNGRPDTNGIVADQDAAIHLGASMVVSNFDIGLFAANHSSIYAHHSTVSHNRSFGVYALKHSAIFADNATASSNNIGFAAVTNSSLSAVESIAENNVKSCFIASHGSALMIIRAKDFNSGNIGIHAWLGSQIQAVDATSVGSATDYLAEKNSFINR